MGCVMWCSVVGKVVSYRMLASSLLMRFSSSSRARAFLMSAMNWTRPRMLELLLLDRPRKPVVPEEAMVKSYVLAVSQSRSRRRSVESLQIAIGRPGAVRGDVVMVDRPGRGRNPVWRRRVGVDPKSKTVMGRDQKLCIIVGGSARPFGSQRDDAGGQDTRWRAGEGAGAGRVSGEPSVGCAAVGGPMLVRRWCVRCRGQCVRPGLGGILTD